MKSVKIFWSLWKYAVPATLNVFLSVLCYAIGWFLSDGTSSMPLARAGAFATMIAIGFTVYDFRRALEEGEERAKNIFSKITTSLPITGQNSQDRIKNRLRQNTNRATNTINIVNTAVLMVATLVWGFGDLAIIWIHTPT